jgi:[acyl-carrier-protein] S-malonyltransferase
MVTNIILFPGQGAQYAGMGKDFHDASPAVRELFELASECSGIDMREVLFTGDAGLLKQTAYTQMAVTLVNMAAYTILRERGIAPHSTAGFSLGELSAYHAAGIITSESLFTITAARGRIMGEHADRTAQQVGELGMAAVIGLGYDLVDELCAAHPQEHLYIANDNSEKQIVLAGVTASIDAIIPVLKEAGARRVIPLQVSGPFHTPLMAGAAREFEQLLDSHTFSDPTVRVYTNVTGRILSSGSEARRACALQLTSPVRWTGIVNDIVRECTSGEYRCYEAGPGKVLSGFWKAGPAAQACIPVGTWESASIQGEHE